MTARDLLQQRFTLPNGDTAWRPSPLVTAAIEGKLLLLDGIHRVNLGTLAVLSRLRPTFITDFSIVVEKPKFTNVICCRLLHDRELDLYDGTRLLRWDRYQALKEENNFTDAQLKERYTHSQMCLHNPLEQEMMT